MVWSGAPGSCARLDMAWEALTFGAKTVAFQSRQCLEAQATARATHQRQSFDCCPYCHGKCHRCGCTT